MDERICLDTDACIEIIKGTDIGKFIGDNITDKEIFISSITVFELYLRSFNIDKIDLLLERVNIIAFDGEIAKKSSEIDKDLKRLGIILDIRDLFIAVSCITNDLDFITLNTKHFESIKELKLFKL